MASDSATPAFPSWTFQIPVDVANAGLQIAIYGQDPASKDWLYWDASSTAYVQFPAAVNGQYTVPLITAATSQAGDTGMVSYSVTLPGSQCIQSGVVAMFIGGSTGIPVTSGVPASPTTSTNGGDVYGIFEFTYAVPSTGGPATLDIDISNVDQVGFTYVVSSADNAPFPLSRVGSSVAQGTLFADFASAFPPGNAFNECLVYGRSSSGAQLRVLAPQDVLAAITPPDTPSYVAPTGAPSSTDPFATGHSYFYLVTESSACGQTAPNTASVFGGYLLTTTGQPSAAGIDIGWQSSGTPAAYTPVNASTTGLNIYRAAVKPLTAGATVPPAPTTGYGLVTGMTIAEWNAQTGYVYYDTATSTDTQAPKNSSYGFSALSTWFDQPLQEFFQHYQSTALSLYQFNQGGGGANGTLWTGNVLEVTPQTGRNITTQTYIDQTGTAQSITATWQWGDGTQSYMVLQLVGNAYDPSNYSNTAIAQASGLTQGEYQGAVLNIYFPYFQDNTGLTEITLPGGTIYALPTAPTWLDNSANSPSQMVFGCAGVFATSNDLDALAQHLPVLAGNALTNLENVIVSGLNRGVATGYGFALAPQQYTCLYGLSQAPAAAAQTGAVPPGTYTYYLSATLNNNSETALTWGQTVSFTAASAVTLTWLPQSVSLYQQVNIYRQAGAGSIALVGTVANGATALATSFTDQNNPPPQPPSGGPPYVFYPAWNDSTSAGYVPSNLFSAFLHQNASADPGAGISINGLVYGYPFDDQGNFSTNINYGTSFPSGITFQISTLS